MGREFEEPISRLVARGAQAVLDDIRTNGPWRWFLWVALIFLKTHLKDKYLRTDRDQRVGDARLADQYDWRAFHHIHTVARSFHVKSDVAPEVLGSVWCLPVRSELTLDKFDYADLSAAQTALIRLGEVALLVVLNDSCGALNGLRPLFKRITAPVSEIQLRELMAEMAYVSVHIAERPTYHSHISDDGQHSIYAEIPEKFSLAPLDRRVRGDLLNRAIGDMLRHIETPGLDKDKLRQAVAAGEWTFLFDEKGDFIKGPIRIGGNT